MITKDTPVTELKIAPVDAELRVINNGDTDSLWITFPDGVEIEMTVNPTAPGQVVVRGWVDERHVSSMVVDNKTGVTI